MDSNLSAYIALVKMAVDTVRQFPAKLRSTTGKFDRLTNSEYCGDSSAINTTYGESRRYLLLLDNLAVYGQRLQVWVSS